MDCDNHLVGHGAGSEWQGLGLGQEERYERVQAECAVDEALYCEWHRRIPQVTLYYPIEMLDSRSAKNPQDSPEVESIQSARGMMSGMLYPG